MAKLVLTTCFILFVFALSAQGKKTNPEKLREDAEFFTLEGEHEKAYQVFKELIAIDPHNYLYKFQCGLSALHLPFRKNETIGIFEDIIKTNDQEKMELNSYLGKKYESIPVYYLGR